MKKGSNGEPQNITDFTEKEDLPVWTSKDIIRHRKTGHAYLVVHVYRVCTMIIDLSSKDELVQTQAILPREYHWWRRDTDMINEDAVNYEGKWRAHTIHI